MGFIRAKRLWGCYQTATIILNNGIEYPKSHCVKIILDKKKPVHKKEHQILWQQGVQYGTVGDYCYSLNHTELLELEQKGMIKIQWN